MDRRNFIKLTAAASAAAVVPFHVSPIPQRKLARVKLHDHRTFNMATDCKLDHKWGTTINERVEAWYWNLADILKEKGRAKWVTTHPCTIYNMFIFAHAWHDLALLENVPGPEVVLWKAGTRGFWSGRKMPESHQTLVWAHRGYPTFWLNENIDFCGRVKRALAPRLTDRMDFVCERGSFRLDTYWGDL